MGQILLQHSTYVGLALEEPHWLLRVPAAEGKGAEGVGRLVLKASQQLVQA